MALINWLACRQTNCNIRVLMCHLGKFLGRAFEIPKGLHGEAFFAAVTLKVVAAPAVSWNSISHKIWYYWTPCHLILTTCLLCNLCLAPTIRMLRWGLTLETHPSSTYHRYNYMCTFWATLLNLTFDPYPGLHCSGKSTGAGSISRCVPLWAEEVKHIVMCMYQSSTLFLVWFTLC